jgi:pullulanase/glycogen debranching enzyme
LGASWDGEGVNFALFSENASGVELCLFDTDDGETRLELTTVKPGWNSRKSTSVILFATTLTTPREETLIS